MDIFPESSIWVDSFGHDWIKIERAVHVSGTILTGDQVDLSCDNLSLIFVDVLCYIDSVTDPHKKQTL